GCDGRDPVGCSGNTTCPPGHVCLSRKCEQICGIDADCASGRYCNGEICLVGDRGKPEISDISGKGSPDDCQVATGNPCLGTAIVVTGANLGGSEFELVPDSATATTIALTTPAGGRLQDNLVDLAPVSPDVLREGLYILVATNAAGATQTEAFQLLQGDKGDKGDPGNSTALTGAELVIIINGDSSAGTIDAAHVAPPTGDAIITSINASTGVIDAARVAGGSGGGGTLFKYDNSDTAVPATVAPDKMWVRVTGSTEGVSTLDINHAKLVELCGDEDGCTLSLATTRWGVVNGSGVRIDTIAAPLVGAPCRFFIEPGSGDWAVSTACSQWYGTWDADGSGNPIWNGNAGNAGFYTPYYTATYGTDGVGGGGAVVLHNRACYLAESVPDTVANNGQFTADSAPGFHLIASHPSWGGAFYPGDSFWDSADAQRACELIVED
ncbi:MAG: hypothetical protein V3T05_10215, partial [Myxococcota bacterium]